MCENDDEAVFVGVFLFFITPHQLERQQDPGTRYATNAAEKRAAPPPAPRLTRVQTHTCEYDYVHMCAKTSFRTLTSVPHAVVCVGNTQWVVHGMY